MTAAMRCNRRMLLSGGMALLGSAGLGSTSAGCSQKPQGGVAESSAPAAISARAVAAGEWTELSFPPDGDNPEGQAAMVYAPEGSVAWPTLIALHGRGEAGRGIVVGAHGWRDDYDLDLVREKLVAGELTSDLAKGMETPERLVQLTASLAARAYEGIVTVCPYTPVPRGRRLTDALGFGRFLRDKLLPRVLEHRRMTKSDGRVGIDGVSMGGRYALQLGFAMPAVFRSVGALQPAIQPDEAAAFADDAEIASRGNPQSLRLVSSTEDPFLEATQRLHQELVARGLKSQLVVTDGPHDYIWNRGPGAIEMLMFHERVLRGLPAP